MNINDWILLAILIAGGIMINWNIISKDVLQRRENKLHDLDSRKNLHVKARKTMKKKVS